MLSTYKQWTNTDRSTIETLVETADLFIASLINKLKILLRHSFVAKQQSQYLNHLKESIIVGIILALGDFSENFHFVFQDASQGFHWNNNQATIHPFIFYFRTETNLLRNDIFTCIFIIISDCLKHDSTAVNLFQKYFFEFLRKNYNLSSEVIYFSDGSGKQYKNRNHFLNVSFHESDFDIKAEWHFFATSHGKNAYVMDLEEQLND